MTAGDLGHKLFYERQIDSFTRLMREVRMLDSDAGIRLLGTYKGKSCLVFISRSAGGYAAIVCSVRRISKPFPGRRILAVEFNRVRELEEFLKGLADKRLQAYVY